MRTTGQFINEGTFWGLTQGGAFTIAEGAWTNSGTLQQGGVDKFYVAPGASLTNTGQIFMRGDTFDNRGVIESSGDIEVTGLAIFHNVGGQLLILSGGSFENWGEVVNYSSSTFDNAGAMAATMPFTFATFQNNGNILLRCGGTVTGTVDGNQPQELCAS